MEFLTGFLGSNSVLASLAFDEAIIGLIMAFVLGQVAAWLYVYTHVGLSYSRAFVQSIIILTVVLCMGMMVIGNNIAIAFGLIGALAVIRFRNILKDTRDTAFIFFTLIVGLATGTGRYRLAILGTVVFGLVVLYLHWTQFGSRDTSDGFIRFRIDLGRIAPDAIRDALDRYCRATTLISQRFPESGDGEMAYRLVMRNPRRADEFVEYFRGLSGVSQVSFVLHEEQSEV